MGNKWSSVRQREVFLSTQVKWTEKESENEKLWRATFDMERTFPVITKRPSGYFKSRDKHSNTFLITEPIQEYITKTVQFISCAHVRRYAWLRLLIACDYQYPTSDWTNVHPNRYDQWLCYHWGFSKEWDGCYRWQPWARSTLSTISCKNSNDRNTDLYSELVDVMASYPPETLISNQELRLWSDTSWWVALLSQTDQSQQSLMLRLNDMRATSRIVLVSHWLTFVPPWVSHSQIQNICKGTTEISQQDIIPTHQHVISTLTTLIQYRVLNTETWVNAWHASPHNRMAWLSAVRLLCKDPSIVAMLSEEVDRFGSKQECHIIEGDSKNSTIMVHVPDAVQWLQHTSVQSPVVWQWKLDHYEAKHDVRLNLLTRMEYQRLAVEEWILVLKTYSTYNCHYDFIVDTYQSICVDIRERSAANSPLFTSFEMATLAWYKTCQTEFVSLRNRFAIRGCLLMAITNTKRDNESDTNWFMFALGLCAWCCVYPPQKLSDIFKSLFRVVDVVASERWHIWFVVRWWLHMLGVDTTFLCMLDKDLQRAFPELSSDTKKHCVDDLQELTINVVRRHLFEHFPSSGNYRSPSEYYELYLPRLMNNEPIGDDFLLLPEEIKPLAPEVPLSMVLSLDGSPVVVKQESDRDTKTDRPPASPSNQPASSNNTASPLAMSHADMFMSLLNNNEQKSPLYVLELQESPVTIYHHKQNQTPKPKPQTKPTTTTTTTTSPEWILTVNDSPAI